MGLFDRGSDPHEVAGEVRNALAALRDSIESKADDTTRNVQAALAEYEKNVAQPRAREAALERKRIDAIEKSVKTGAPLDRYGEPNWALSGYGRGDNPEYKAFFAWLTARNEAGIKKAEVELKSAQTKTLRTDDNPGGGYLIPQVMDAQIKKNIIEISPVRAHARLRVMRSKSMDHPAPLVGADRAVRG